MTQSATGGRKRWSQGRDKDKDLLVFDIKEITTRAKWWIVIKSVALASEGSEFKILVFALQTILNNCSKFHFPYIYIAQYNNTYFRKSWQLLNVLYIILLIKETGMWHKWSWSWRLTLFLRQFLVLRSHWVSSSQIVSCETDSYESHWKNVLWPVSSGNI